MRWVAIAMLALTGVVQYILHYNPPSWGELDAVFGPGDGQQYAVPTLAIQVALIAAMVLPWVGRVGRVVALAWSGLLGAIYGSVGLLTLIHHPVISVTFLLFAAAYGLAAFGLWWPRRITFPAEPRLRGR